MIMRLRHLKADTLLKGRTKMILSELHNGKNLKTEIGKTSFDSEFDIIVCGLGTAGSIALIAAGRRGIKTLGIEKLNCMGGSATAGGVSGYYFGLEGGIFEEIDRKAKELQADYLTEGRAFHADAKKYILEDEALKAGTEISYGTSVIGVFLDGKKIRGLRCVTPHGMKNISCKILIDATGDGEVCAIAGAEFRYGRASDGCSQPYTNVRYMVKDGKLGYSNFDAGYIDPRSGKSVSDGITHAGCLHLMERVEENERIVFAAALNGGREGRLIVGEETLCFEDVISGRVTDTPVFYEYSNHDTHSRDWAFESEILQKWLTVANLWGQNFTVPVPLGTMIARGYSGLLSAGRCISVDHDMAQSVRMQRTMQKSGEAIAAAAALSLKMNVEIKDVPYQLLRDELLKSGCLNSSFNGVLELINDTEILKETLASVHPGIAIWTAYVNKGNFDDMLSEWILSREENLSKHSALALGLRGNPKALPLLKKIVMERDMFIPDTKRSLRGHRMASAIYLLGELGDTELIEELAVIFKSALPFDIRSNAMTALLKIASQKPEQRENISSLLLSVLSAPDFKIELLMKVDITVENMTEYCRILVAKHLDAWGIKHELGGMIREDKLSLREKSLKFVEK